MTDYQPLIEEDNGQPTGIVVSGAESKSNKDDTAVTSIPKAGHLHASSNSEVSSLGIGANFDEHRSHVSDNVWDEDDYDILNNIISRNYALLFFLTMFGAFIGLIIYVITNNKNYIWLGGCIGFCIAFVIDLLFLNFLGYPVGIK